MRLTRGLGIPAQLRHLVPIRNCRRATTKLLVAMLCLWLVLQQVVQYQQHPSQPVEMDRRWIAAPLMLGDVKRWEQQQQQQQQQQQHLTDNSSISGKGSSMRGNLTDQWDSTMQDRIQQVRDACTSRSSDQMTIHDESRVYQQMLVDDVHKVLYCVVPKAACTSWKEALVFMTGKLNHTNPRLIRHDVHDDKYLVSKGLKSLTEQHFNRKERAKRLKDYVKIMTVRHPFERLLSAYRDKFAQKNQWTRYFHHKYGTRIIQACRKNPSREQLVAGSDVTFEEFLTFISDDALDYEYRFNVHWMPYQNLCQPCKIHYDYVIKMETLNEDSHEILHQVFNSTLGLFPKVNSKAVGSSNLTRAHYSSIPQGIVQRLFKLYDVDFRMFGYEW